MKLKTGETILIDIKADCTNCDFSAIPENMKIDKISAMRVKAKRHVRKTGHSVFVETIYLQEYSTTEKGENNEH